MDIFMIAKDCHSSSRKSTLKILMVDMKRELPSLRRKISWSIDWREEMTCQSFNSQKNYWVQDSEIMAKTSKTKSWRHQDRVMGSSLAFSHWFRDRQFSTNNQANQWWWNIFATRPCLVIWIMTQKSKTQVLCSFMHKISRIEPSSARTHMDAIMLIKPLEALVVPAITS